MPQDELWRASARLTGYTMKLELEPLFDGNDCLTLCPTWSKMPSHGRNGFTSVFLPTYARAYVPGLVTAAHHELMGGAAKHVPAVVKHELRSVLQDFEAGIRS